MKKSFIAGLAVICFALPLIALGQPCRVIGGTSTERANVIVNAFNPTNGFVLAGYTQSFGPGLPNSNALVVRTQPDGTPVSALVTTGTRAEEATSMIRTSDGCYLITGYTRSYNAAGTNADIFVIKVKDDLATVRWAKVYHMATNDYDHVPNSIIEASAALGGGYVLTGWYNPSSTTARWIMVMRLDVNGNVTWTRLYNYANDLWDEGCGITEVNDAANPDIKFCVVGYCAASSTTQTDAFVMRLKSDGNIFFTEVMAGTSDEQARAVIWDPTGVQPGLVISGWTKSYGGGAPNYSNIWVAKLKTSRTAWWSNVYYWPAGTSELEERIVADKSLIATSGALGTGYALVGYTFSRGYGVPNNPNMLALKLDYNGGIGWGGAATVHPSTATYNYRDVASSIVPGVLPSGAAGYAITGWTNSFNTPSPLLGDNFHFAMLDAAGHRTQCAQYFAMQKTAFDWTWKNFTTSTRTTTNQSITIQTVLPSSQAVCGGLLMGMEPEVPNEMGSVNELNAAGLRIAPNPFNGFTNATYSVPRAGRVKLSVYSVTGKLISAIGNEHLTAGNYTTRINGAKLDRGIYLLKLEGEGFSSTEKLLVK